MACKKDHSAIQDIMADLPLDQGGKGRHKCAACAYEKGFEAGKELEEIINLSEIFDSLEESQAKNQRHKRPHSAFAQGYLDGVQAYYDNR